MTKNEEALFHSRLARHMDELRWLYMELYQNDAMFAELCDNLHRFAQERSAPLKKRDLEREADPQWYKSNDLTGMMLYIDNFAGDLNGVRKKLSYKDDPKKADDSRYLHRGKFRWELEGHAHDLNTPEGQVFCGLNALGALRKTNPAFGTGADVWTLDTGDNGLLAIGRYLEGQKIIGVFNFTPDDKRATFPHDPGEFSDMLTGETYILRDLSIPAYGFYYLEQTQI